MSLGLLLVLARGAFTGGATNEPTTSSSPEPTAAAATGREASEFVRSSAASARNLQLLGWLESNLGPNDYQLVYPQLGPLPAGVEPDRSRLGHVSQRLRLARQSNLRQPSFVPGASNWLQPGDRQAGPNQPASPTGLGTGTGTGTATATGTAATSASNAKLQQTKTNQLLGHYNRTNVVIKAFNYKLRLDLELNNNLFGPNLIQKHFLPKGVQQISTQKLEHCYYHASTQNGAQPTAIGAFRTCNGLSGIIHVDNESFVIHPLFDADLSKKYPHIIYRYQSGSNQADQAEVRQQQQPIVRQCGNARLHQWALRQYNSNSSISNSNNINNNVISTAGGAKAQPQRQRFERNDSNPTRDEADWRPRQQQQHYSTSNSKGSAPNDNCDDGSDQDASSACKTTPRQQPERKRTTTQTYRKFIRDVSLTEKYIELALVLSQDMFDKRNSSSRLEVLHDSIQIINCLDLYFRYSANTRVALIYLETWAHGDQIDLSSSNEAKQILYNFLEYTTRKLYRISMDAAHLLTGGHARTFAANEMGMAIPDSICSTRAVSVSQEASTFEPFIAASTMAHMLGHNLGMEHDDIRRPDPVGGADELAGDPPTLSQPAAHLGGPEMVEPASSREHQHRPDPKPQTMRTAAAAARHYPIKTTTTSKHLEESQELAEEHDDEIKGRSLASHHSSPNYDDEQQELLDDKGAGFAGEQEQWCSSNCLMSETFTYVQPPVSFGNMIQQQVAAAAATPNSTGGSILSMFAQSGGDDSGEPTIEPHHFRAQTGASQQLPFRFSRKSIDTYHRLLRQSRGVCLFNKPNQLEDFRTCGNGIVDRDEDCDCGNFQECLESGDTCCDPITCRFKADAECINGACCDRCKLRPRGLVCRRARNECDLSEVCDGKSGQCAPDVHKQNGQPCSNGTGFCYLGQCPTHTGQCAELWGPEARKSHRYCYSNFNSNGTIRGNCGQEPQSQAGTTGGVSSSSAPPKKYRRCEQENILCGTIQCQMGDMKPITAWPMSDINGSSSGGSSQEITQQAEYSKKVIHSIDGTSHECKTITGPASSISYVRDGTKCSANRVCFNQTCQPLDKVYRDSFELCPRDEGGRQCSANGICSTAHRCHCEPGWLGHDCSQRAPSPAPTGVHTDAGQSAPEQTKPALTLLDPINVTEMPQSSQPHATATTITLEPQMRATASPHEIQSAATTTTTSATTTTGTTAPITTTVAPPPVVSASNVVLDKKKHDAMGAPALVFILVSIVAAVYLGFALMANCYRRKGFIKPDKVLRHHQMNCKLDALRSSFIAKRLADAAVLGSFDHQPGGSASLMQPPLLAAGHELPSHFQSETNLFAQAPASAQFAMQEAMPMQPPYDTTRGPQQRGFLPSAFKRYPFSGLRGGRTLSSDKPMLEQTAAQVHYFDGAGQHDQHGLHDQHGHRGQHQQRLDYQMDPSGSCDHLPLLMTDSNHLRQPQTSMHSFKSHHSRPSNYPAGAAGPVGRQQARGNSISRQLGEKSFGASNINRATSLGSVNARQEQWNSSNLDRDQGEAAGARSRYAHRALATPLRAGRTYRHGSNGAAPPAPPPPPPMGEDSFSGISSPEHGFGETDWARADSFMGAGGSTMGRQSNPRSLPAPLGAQSSAGYHEDLLMDAALNRHRNDEDDDDDLEELPLTPPPPPSKPSTSARLAACDQQQVSDAFPTTEEDSADLSTVVQRQHPNPKRQSEPELGQRDVSPVWLRQPRVKRIPLNNLGQDDHDDDDYHGAEDEPEPEDEQLSLLSQLRQLEQVQSLHQRQVANHKPTNEAGTLHEFFSLPLSVQLSALLARSLSAAPNQPTWQQTPIDEYLNTLNSSSVATMSRRSFKGSTKQQQQQQKQTVASGSGGSRSGTLKRQQQQMKLQNLQSLITRLQKLHQHQQQRQGHQQTDDMDDFQTESVYEQSSQRTPQSRQSTLGRHRNSRHLATVDDSGNSTRRRTSRRPISRGSPDNRNESVYSMSDSEDGATYASRTFKPNVHRHHQQQQQQPSRQPPETMASGQERQAKNLADGSIDADANKRPPETVAKSIGSNQCQSSDSNNNKQENRADQDPTNGDLNNDESTRTDDGTGNAAATPEN